MTTTHVWADDLSGAAELASMLRPESGDAFVALDAPGARPLSATVHDLDLRHETTDAASRRISELLARVDPGDRVALKIDSQLAGPLEGYVAAFRAHGRDVAFCAANPSLQRWTVRGHHHVPKPTGAVVTNVRSRLAGTPDATEIVFDAADEAAMIRAARASRDRDAIGSAPFIAAWMGEPFPRAEPLPRHPQPSQSRVRSALVVVGSSEPVIDQQIAALHSRPTLLIEGADLTAPAAAHAAADGLASGLVVVLRAPGHAVRRAATVAAQVAAFDPGGEIALVLTGGHTARTVLDEIGHARLRAAPQGLAPHAGVTTFACPDGRLVFIKPGSYGDPSTLSLLVQSVLPRPSLELR